jgi:hypothetical protein
MLTQKDSVQVKVELETAEAQEKLDRLTAAAEELGLKMEKPDVTPAQARAIATAAIGAGVALGLPVDEGTQTILLVGAGVVPAVWMLADAVIRVARAKHLGAHLQNLIERL